MEEREELKIPYPFSNKENIKNYRNNASNNIFGKSISYYG